jgi:hypothetical protein
MTSTRMSPLEDAHLLHHILSYVGGYQFRFVASVNQEFKATYIQLFPDKQTYFDASTVEIATICYTESSQPCPLQIQQQLCRSAVKHGSLAALQYLR